MKRKYLLIIIIVLLLTGCKSKTYSVTFINEDGTKLSSINIEKGKNIEDIELPEKEGYIFVNWLKDGLVYDESLPINEDLTLTATWIETPEIITNYTVTFKFGDETKTQTVKKDEKVTKPSDPKKEKHKFIGWYVGETLFDFDTAIEKDIVITAKFEKSRVLINFELDGGSGTLQKEINKGSILDIPKTPEKFGYNFIRWELNGQEYKFDTPVTEDITLKAIYEAIEYVIVTFDTDGGKDIPAKTIKKDSLLENIEIPTKEGYTFKYWSYEEKEFNYNTEISSDIILKAIYEENIKSEESID